MCDYFVKTFNKLGFDVLFSFVTKSLSMFMSCHQTVGQIRNLVMLTNKNCIHKEMKRRLNKGNACYHSVQNFFFCLLSENLKIKIYRTIILPLVLYGCENLVLYIKDID
jgi:hypothetical protein